VDDGRTVELRVGSAGSELVERIRKEELSRDIGALASKHSRQSYIVAHSHAPR
jgi:hypothetical protein